MKGIVDYKHPKKMKKRRQLDALVDTVKLPRSRKNSSSAQELLDCHSDSSEVDELTLSQSTSKKKNRCCICQSIAAQIGLFMVTMACLTTCVAIIWVQWHLRQELETMRKQIAAVQNSETVPPTVLKIQSQLAEVNKSMTAMKTGQYGLQEITNIIIDIKSKLKDLNDANTRLQKSVSASEEVLGLPAKMSTLSSMLATLGSDFKDFMNMQTSRYTEIEKRVAAVETEVKEANRSPNNGLDSQLSQISQDLMSFNMSLNMGFQNANRELERQSVRISTLEEFTKSHSLSNGPELPNDSLLVLKREIDNLNNRLDSHEGALINLTTAVRSIKNKGTAKDPASSLAKTTTLTSASIKASPSQSSEVKTGEGDTFAAVIHIEGINTSEDLVKAFNGTLPLKDGQLDIEALNNLTNATLNVEQLKQFDADRNGLYSQVELSKALGFP